MSEGIETARCPRCGLGFAPGTATCPVCHVPLGGPGGPGPENRTEPEEEVALPDLDEDPASLASLRTAPPAWVRELLERLTGAGIPARTKASRRPPDLTVFVREQDLPRARVVDREVLASEVPESGMAPAVEDVDTERCPGCGSPVDDSDRACPECELTLVPAEGWTCSTCGGSIEIEVAVCPHCGTGIDWGTR